MATTMDAAASGGNPKGMVWTGRVISGLIAAAMAASAVGKFIGGETLETEMPKIGWAVEKAVPLGIVELTCAILYAIPQTAVLGAILLTGYLGGAIATHVRVDDVFFIQAGLGVLAWLGLFFRDARLRALLPWRRLN